MNRPASELIQSFLYAASVFPDWRGARRSDWPDKARLQQRPMLHSPGYRRPEHRLVSKCRFALI